MKKKVFLFSILIISLIFVAPFLIADECTEEINKAYTCLEEKTERCDRLSFEQKIFSLLALGECEDDVLSDPKYMSDTEDIKFTAQAILALNKAGVDTTEAETWLLSQTMTPLNLVWYLEIESTEETTCTITYDDSPYDITIGLDKKINTGAGTCLVLESSDIFYPYFLKIKSSCYEKEFTISCDKEFFTTLLYRKPDSYSDPTLHVSKDISSPLGGETTEKINSLCFTQGGFCNYEGSLWAALALDLNRDVSSYLPYLVIRASESENTKYLPDAFLYHIMPSHTTFLQNLLSNQKSGGYWEASSSNDRFYNTALALLPLYYESSASEEKTKAKNWLLENQDEGGDNDGCWNSGNVRDTGFILYSVWPECAPGEPAPVVPVCGDGNIEGNEECDGSHLNSQTCITQGYAEGGDLSCYASGTANECTFNTSGCIGEIDCEIAGYSCMLEADCNGTVLDDYVCSDEGDICCDELGTCNDKNGIICAYDETCTGEKTTAVSDLGAGEECCLTGRCAKDSEDIDCEDAGYYCMSSASCEDAGGDILDNYVCFGINVCCTKSKISNECVEDLGGEVCSSDEVCDGGIWEDASDLDYSQRCCVGGTCEESSAPECEYYGGVCRASCNDDEEENNDECEYSGDVCCVEKTETKETGSYWWIWVLLSLIVLTLIGIIFRDKLRPFWLRIKRSKPSKPGFFPPSRTTGRRIMPRRILPPTQKRPTTRAAPHHPVSKPKPKGEIDDVLKKLKEMGK